MRRDRNLAVPSPWRKARGHVALKVTVSPGPEKLLDGGCFTAQRDVALIPVLDGRCFETGDLKSSSKRQNFPELEPRMTQDNLKSALPKVWVCVRITELSLVSLCMLIAVACGGGPAAEVAESTIVRLPEGTVSATGNPLVAQYTISPPAAAKVTVEFSPDLTYALSTSPQTSAGTGEPVTVLVAGMKQNTTYHMRALVTYSDGSQQFDSDHTFQTGAIPTQRIPTVKLTAGSAASAAPGVELMSLTIGNANQLLALATDPAGNVIWYYDYDPSLGIPQPIKLLPNGHMMIVLYLQGAPGGTVQEIDLAGNVMRQFDYNALSQKLHAAGYNIQVFSIDHDFVALPNGHLLLIVSDTRVFTDLPGYPGQTTVMGNAIVDLDANNNPVWVWDAFDHLDVNRHPMSFPDWIHANALVYGPDDGNLFLSSRHQSWILKIDYANGNGAGDIIWKLGYQGDFDLGSDLLSDWFYAQHDANIVSSNSTGNFQMAVFDNGDDRIFDSSGTTCVGASLPYCYSTAAIFQVDETAKTASRGSSHVTPYSFWGGATRVLPNSNVYVDETAPLDLNLTGSRVMEVTQNPVPAIVWQLQIDGQNSYRTIHLPSLYPDVQW
jgi:arylsulfate sulfotransferase